MRSLDSFSIRLEDPRLDEPMEMRADEIVNGILDYYNEKELSNLLDEWDERDIVVLDNISETMRGEE